MRPHIFSLHKNQLTQIFCFPRLGQRRSAMARKKPLLATISGTPLGRASVDSVLEYAGVSHPAVATHLLATYGTFLPLTVHSCHLRYILATYGTFLPLTVHSCHLRYILATYGTFLPLTVHSCHLRYILATYGTFLPLTVHYRGILATYGTFLPLTVPILATYGRHSCHLRYIIEPFVALTVYYIFTLKVNIIREFSIFTNQGK